MRLVAMTTLMLWVASKPSSWLSSSSIVRCTSLSPPPPLSIRDDPIESISSMKMMDGACSRAITKSSRTIREPSPMYFWTSSEPETRMKVHSVWCATARASRVLPVPGGPYSSTPLGCEMPSASNSSGCLTGSSITWNGAVGRVGWHTSRGEGAAKGEVSNEAINEAMPAAVDRDDATSGSGTGNRGGRGRGHGDAHLFDLLNLLIETADHLVGAVGHLLYHHQRHERVHLVREQLVQRIAVVPQRHPGVRDDLVGRAITARTERVEGGGAQAGMR